MEQHSSKLSAVEILHLLGGVAISFVDGYGAALILNCNSEEQREIGSTAKGESKDLCIHVVIGLPDGTSDIDSVGYTFPDHQTAS
eukprot:CAMPEP_0178613908 /NCGR_PEP_ID=MMETSP0698-20121128/1892_1 /TAXON_ID=265572 /ORGANISM="Extubocellulus spinifer, Strain CCMP396" /LENGTH=84 /DNA_ID=CAMNT_0020252629 /DNA_START=106 /DNA_END=363 /DNA_ORIENTATION=-